MKALYENWNAAVDCLFKETEFQDYQTKLEHLSDAKKYFRLALKYCEKIEDAHQIRLQFLYILDEEISIFFEEIKSNSEIDYAACQEFHEKCHNDFASIFQLQECLDEKEKKGGIYYNLGLGYYRLIDHFKDNIDFIKKLGNYSNFSNVIWENSSNFIFSMG